MDHDEKAINEVVLPLLNVSRYLPDGTINEKEPNQQILCIKGNILCIIIIKLKIKSITINILE